MTEANNWPPFWSMINRHLWRTELIPAAFFVKDEDGIDLVKAIATIPSHYRGGRMYEAANDAALKK